MDRNLAVKAKKKALNAIEILHSILAEKANWDSPNMLKLKRGIGLSIGSIEVDLLSVVYKEFSDLDDFPAINN
jgi:hypothetical protein